MSTTYPMPSADAAWFRMDRPTNHMVINSVLTFDAPLELERLRTIVAERLVGPFPRYRQLVVEPGPLRAPHWEDDPHFDLDRHLHHVALPAPGDRAALEQLVGDLMAAGLDRDKPLWDMYLVDGFGDGCALICRMHHCIADGIALAQVMLMLTDTPGADGTPEIAPPSGAHRRRLPLPLPPIGGVLHESMQTLVHPGRIRELAGAAAADATALLELLLTPSEHETQLKGDHGVAQRVAWTPALPLADVKAIAHASHTTVNDVLVAALSGALARYLAEEGEEDESLRMMVPFNIRPAGEPLPADLGNRFGLIMLDLPIRARSARVRLGEVHRRMLAIKRSRQPAMSYLILSLMGHTPPLVEAAIIDIFSAKATAVVTNVPGPRDTVTLAGVPVNEVLVWAPCAGSVGMSVSIFSYRDTVTVGFMTHASLTPEPARLADAVAAELAALHAETV